MSQSVMYIATITVQVPLKVDASKRIGGQPYSADEVAAYEAWNATGYIEGAMEQVHESGSFSILAMGADVTRLARLDGGTEVEPDWKHR